ncbi:MAG: carboxypeptidase regulatory-like domain-containing protein [Candidatus Methylomirabilales bacterium]
MGESQVRSWKDLRSQKGFTLIEVILILILIGILAALAVNLLANSLDQSRFDETFKEMNTLSKAMTGNPELLNAEVRSDFGFVGDMGGRPTALTGLLQQGGLPAWTVYDTDLGTGTGWRGPYIDDQTDDGGTFLATLDGWGNAYGYNAATGQVTSNGSDGAAGGTGFAADFTVPETSLITTGNVNGRVIDHLGNPVRSTTVTIRHPDPASLGTATDTTATTNSDGSFSVTGIPIGKHRIQVIVGTETIKKVVAVLPNQTVNVTLQASSDPTIPSAPTGLTATRANFSQINLSWTAPTTNTDGSSLIDLAGYNIYRSTTAGFTPGPSNLTAHIDPVTTFEDLKLTAGTTYYYRIAAIDRANNEGTFAAEVSETVNPIQQRAEATGNTTPTHTIPIRNLSSASITVTTIVITWAGDIDNVVKRLQFRPNPGPFTTVWNGEAATGSTITLTTPFSIPPGTNAELRIRFGEPGEPGFVDTEAESMTIQFNTVDGFIKVGYEPV